MRLILLSLTIIALSCNSNTSSPSENPARDTVSGEAQEDRHTFLEEDCYWKILQRDTFAMHLILRGDSISGKLSFDNFEKDASSGTVHGINNHGVYHLWYDFQSEGMSSVMELYFKKEGNTLIRGVGPMEVKGDSSYFPNSEAVKFSTIDAFDKLECQGLPDKYKQ
jgi:hypothetical protein